MTNLYLEYILHHYTIHKLYPMKNTMKGIIGVGVLIIIVLVTYSFGLRGSEDQTQKEEIIPVGVLASLTGSASPYGIATQRGFELAANEINNAGGIDGKKIKLVFEDEACEARVALDAFKKLVEVEGIKIILGPTCSSGAIAIASLANEKKVLIISAGASSPDLTEVGGEYFFRTYPSDAHEAVFAADTVFKNFGKRTAASIYINNDYGAALERSFTTQFEKNGGTILVREAFELNASDFRTQLSKIQAAKPDLIYIVGYNELGELVKQIQELRIQSLVFASSVFNTPEILQITGSSADGVVFTNLTNPESPTRKHFLQIYKEAYQDEATYLVDTAYDAVYALEKALRGRSLENIQEIKDALYDVEFEGASSDIAFGEYGDPIRASYNILTVKNGEVVKY